MAVEFVLDQLDCVFDALLRRDVEVQRQGGRFVAAVLLGCGLDFIDEREEVAASSGGDVGSACGSEGEDCSFPDALGGAGDEDRAAFEIELGRGDEVVWFVMLCGCELDRCERVRVCSKLVV